MHDVVFFDKAEAAGEMRFEPYRVAESGLSLRDVRRRINQLAYHGHGPDYAYGGRGKIVVQSIHDFERMMAGFAQQERIVWQTAHDQIMQASCAGRISANLRHDVDLDLFTALEIARVEAKYNAPSTFYILHTAPYYGTFENGVFMRNKASLEVYRQIQDLGHEIAIHADPYHLYLHHGMDGAECLKAELQWLRDNGIRVTGSVAHNSWPVYGVENFAIFKGRKLRMDKPSGPQAFTFQGKSMPLGVLDEQEMGLAYEGNDIFYLNKGLVEYGCLMRQNLWFCQTNRRLELPEDVDKGSFVFNSWTDQTGFVRHVNGLTRDCFLVVAVHPIYYGLRSHEAANAADIANVSTVSMSQCENWPTFAPSALHAEYHSNANPLKCTQSMSIADENGFFNRPSLLPRGQSEIRVLLVGGENFSGSAVSIESQIQTVVENELERQTGKTVEVYKAAHPGMGLSQVWSWLQRFGDQIKPQFVVVGLKSGELELSLSASPTGDQGADPAANRVVLAVDQTGVSLSGSPTSGGHASFCIANGGLSPEEFGQEFPKLRQLIAFVAEAIRAIGAKPIFMLEQCAEELDLWRSDDDHAKRFQACLNNRMYFKAMFAGMDVTFVDVYPQMVDESQSVVSTHTPDGRQWNDHGHYVAGLALTDEIVWSRG